MSAKPVLAIQTRRLGDLILSIPLFTRLGALYPHSQLRIVAEPQFYDELAPLMPGARFFPPELLPQLANDDYAAIINLGPAPDAAIFTANTRANLRLGRVFSADALRVNGFWQLYRHALTGNNRHNTMHWSDMDFLDLYSSLPVPTIPGQAPRPAGKGIVGLFVGASEAAKRPDAIFWQRLARRLARNGFKPVLLGGKSEIALGAEIAGRLGPSHVNLCGRLSLARLCGALKTLDLLITPDTGPMHLANLLGTPVLNLSMGNVRAEETGPASPGQWVLRGAMSCAGCWQCERSKLYCRTAFNPAAVGNVALALLKNETPAEAVPRGLELLRTCRDEYGLANLEPVGGKASIRTELDAFWRAVFLHFAFSGHENSIVRAVAALRENHGSIAESVARGLARMPGIFNRSFSKGLPLPDDFWQTQPRHSQLFAGYTQMFLQNDDYSSEAWKTAIERAASLAALLA